MVDIKTEPGIHIRTVMHDKHDLLIKLIVQFTEHVQSCYNLLYDALLHQLHSQGRSSQGFSIGRVQVCIAVCKITTNHQALRVGLRSA